MLNCRHIINYVSLILKRKHLRKLLLFLVISLPVLVHGQTASGDGKPKHQTGMVFPRMSPPSPTTFTFIGNVVLGVDETTIKCDSAIVDFMNKTVAAYGHVLISPNSDLRLSSSYTIINYDNKKGTGLNIVHSDKETYQ